MESQLRELMETAVGEPPVRVTVEAVRRRMVRRRVREGAAGLAVVAAVAVVVPVLLNITLGHGSAARPVTACAGCGPVAYVAGADMVTPISTGTNTVGAPFPVPMDGYGGLAITPNGKTLYLSGNNSVIPISTATNAVGKPIKSGYAPNWLTVTPNGKTLYVANLGLEGLPGQRSRPSSVTAVSTATNTVIRTINTGIRPRAIVVTPDSKTAYVINQSSDTVSVINAATNTVIKTIKVGADPLQMAITPDGKTVYTANPNGPGHDSITAISTVTNTVARTFTDCPGPGMTDGEPTIAVTPDSRTAYVICNGPINNLNAGARRAGRKPVIVGEILPISTATNTPAKPINVGPEPQAIAITPDGKTAYVGDYSGTVSMISTATNTVIKTIKVGNGVSMIAITPDGKTAYVASQQAGTVTPINTATNTAGKPIKVHGAWAIAITP